MEGRRSYRKDNVAEGTVSTKTDTIFSQNAISVSPVRYQT